MGLDPTDGALVLCLLSATWDIVPDDALVNNVLNSLKAQIVAAAKAQGMWNDWVYLNYAGSGQNPIGGYGPGNKARLRAFSAKYDLKKVFQKNVPGVFKLFRFDGGGCDG